MKAKIKFTKTLLFLSVFSCAYCQVKDKKFEKDYTFANAYYNTTEPSEQTDNKAVELFSKILKNYPTNQQNVAQKIDAATKTGILHQTYLRYKEALKSYALADNFAKRFNTSPNLIFEAYLNSSTIHYYFNHFDSCYHYLTLAEKIYFKFPKIPKSETLFNTLGVLNFESGNYKQSINFFNKAQDLHLANGEKIKNFAIQSNIASGKRQIGKLAEAIAIYEELLKTNPLEIKIRINLINAYLELKQNIKARNMSRLINISKDPQNTLVYHNLMGKIHFRFNEFKLADESFKKALHFDENTVNHNRNGKNLELGNTYKYLGDIAMSKRSRTEAIEYYQKAIFNLDFNSKSTSVYENPNNFTLNINNPLLFNTLVAKGDCFKEMYLANPNNKKYFVAAEKSYESAFKLVNYMLLQYDTEEARFNFGEKMYPFFDSYFDLLLKGALNFNQKGTVEKAFLLAEKSKSCILAINLREDKITQNNNVPQQLLLDERLAELTKSRLVVKSLENNLATSDSLNKELLNAEIKLSRIQAEIKKYHKNINEDWNLNNFNKIALNTNSTILSFYKHKNNYYAFLLNNSKLVLIVLGDYHAIDSNIKKLNENFKASLTGITYFHENSSAFLYKTLFKPIEKHLNHINKIVILPHYEIARLPFETLKNEKGEYLLNNYEFIYQFSADILARNTRKNSSAERVLAIAPFTNKHQKDFLPASFSEIKNLQGDKLVLTEASKENFSKNILSHSILHLATHAYADNISPERSYVAFYQNNKNDTLKNRMYVDEIKVLNLKTVRLLFLSACETASGKNMNNEGVMSLCRSFLVAGCENVVTTLWKAEDVSNTYIATRFYDYLNNGYTMSKALQKAKLDLLHDPKMAQYHSPAYWGHIVLVGFPVESTVLIRYKIIVFLGILLALVFAVYFRLFTNLKNKLNFN